MSNYDYQKNKLEIGYPMTMEDAKKPIGDRLFITTVAATVLRIFFGLRLLGVGEYGALLASTSLVWFDALYDDQKTYTING